jgi:uncharacterized membrane protein YdbT with pleckstrin-like domain
MSYLDKILEPGEIVRYRTTISWTVYGNGIVVGLASLVCAYFGFKAAIGWLFAVSGALAAIALVVLALALLKRASTEIAVTDRRIVFKRGLLRTHTVEMNMQKVESVDVDQTLLGRLFDYGDVTVRGVGSTFERLDFIDAPLRLRTTVTAS